MKHAFIFLMAFAALVVAGIAGAQAGARPGPADPRAPVPAPEYRSAFSGFRSYSEVELVPWRTANDEVGRSGVHAAAKGASSKAAPKPPAHGEHK